MRIHDTAASVHTDLLVLLRCLFAIRFIFLTSPCSRPVREKRKERINISLHACTASYDASQRESNSWASFPPHSSKGSKIFCACIARTMPVHAVMEFSDASIPFYARITGHPQANAIIFLSPKNFTLRMPGLHKTSQRSNETKRNTILALLFTYFLKLLAFGLYSMSTVTDS